MGRQSHSVSGVARVPRCRARNRRRQPDQCRRNRSRGSIGTFSTRADHPMRYKHRAQRGVTLVELMVALSILSVLLYIATPSFRDAGLPSQLRAISNNIVAATKMARSEAIKRNATVTLCVSSDGQTCG